jgi:hypothetical protein
VKVAPGLLFFLPGRHGDAVADIRWIDDHFIGLREMIVDPMTGCRA